MKPASLGPLGALQLALASAGIASSACQVLSLDSSYGSGDVHVFEHEGRYPARVTPIPVSDEEAQMQPFPVLALDDDGRPTFSENGAIYVRSFGLQARLSIPRGADSVAEFLDQVEIAYTNEALLGPHTLGTGGFDVDWSMSVLGLDNQGSSSSGLERALGSIGNWLRDRFPGLRGLIHEWRDQVELRNVIRTGRVSFKDRIVDGDIDTSETEWIRDQLMGDGTLHWSSLYQADLDPAPWQLEGNEITCGMLGEEGVIPARPDLSRPVPIEAEFTITVTHQDSSGAPIMTTGEPVPLAEVGPDCLNEHPECLGEVQDCLSEFPECADRLAECAAEIPECALTTALCATEFPACLDEVVHLRGDDGTPIIMTDAEGRPVTVKDAMGQPIYKLESGQRLHFDFALQVRDARDPADVSWPGVGLKFSGLPILFLMETYLRPLARRMAENPGRQITGNESSTIEAFKTTISSMCGLESGHVETPRELLDVIDDAYECGCHRILFDHYSGAGPLAFDRVSIRISQELDCEVDLDGQTCVPCVPDPNKGTCEPREL